MSGSLSVAESERQTVGQLKADSVQVKAKETTLQGLYNVYTVTWRRSIYGPVGSEENMEKRTETEPERACMHVLYALVPLVDYLDHQRLAPPPLLLLDGGRAEGRHVWRQRGVCVRRFLPRVLGGAETPLMF